jgi:hypothetical protein
VSPSTQFSIVDRHGNAITEAPTVATRCPPAPVAARFDPPPSHTAASDLEDSGLLAVKKAAVLNLMLTLSEPLTSREVAAAMKAASIKAGRHEAAKRLPDLRDHDKTVENCGERPCRITGRSVLTWRAIDGAAPTNQARPAVTAATGSAPVHQVAPEPAACPRCQGTGRRRVPGSHPVVFGWRDELFARTCISAERNRAIHGDANYVEDETPTLPSESEVLTR